MSTLIFWNVWPSDRPPTAGIRGGTAGSDLPVAQFENLSDCEDEFAKFKMPTLFRDDMDDELRELARQANSKTSAFFRIIWAYSIGKLNSPQKPPHDVSLALKNLNSLFQVRKSPSSTAICHGWQRVLILCFCCHSDCCHLLFQRLVWSAAVDCWSLGGHHEHTCCCSQVKWLQQGSSWKHYQVRTFCMTAF